MGLLQHGPSRANLQGKLKIDVTRHFLVHTGEVYLVHNERATKWPRYGANTTTLSRCGRSEVDEGQQLTGGNVDCFEKGITK